MSFYFSSVAPVLNSTAYLLSSVTRQYVMSDNFKRHLFNALIVLLCLIAFYTSLVIEIVCFCYALAVNSFYAVIDSSEVPPIVEREIDTTVYLPLPTPITGLLMPAKEVVRVIIPVAPLQVQITNVIQECVEFTYKGNAFRASLNRDEFGVSFLKWSYKATKRYLPIKNANIAFADDYNAVTHQCFVALGV